MLRTFHAARRLRTAAEIGLDRLSRRLAAGQLASIEANSLRRSETLSSESGSKPLFFLENQRGERFLLKIAESDLMAAEVVAYELRALGNRPCVPARTVTMTLEGVGEVRGVLKPYVEFDPAQELAPSTVTWTPLQRAVLLMDHAWEWFLDNLDTNTSQYALLGPQQIPVNLDWDRSYCTEGRTELSRFTKYKRTIPNARTFLYADYVQGLIDLPFSLLLSEARLIRNLPTPAVRAALERYAAARFEDAQAREEFVIRVLSRRRRIEHEFRNFVRSLITERRSIVGRPGLRATVHAWWAALWNTWQLVLHRVTRGPVGAFGRGVLRFVRGRRNLPHARQEPGVLSDAIAHSATHLGNS